jgi:hypothetical protein
VPGQAVLPSQAVLLVDPSGRARASLCKAVLEDKQMLLLLACQDA